MRLYREDKGFFLIKQNLQFQNLPPSQVNINQPLDTNSFVEQQGTSEFIKVYAGNTYRTVKTDKPMNLPLEEGVSTTTWDFYRKNGDYLGQMSLFVSLKQNSKGIKNFSKIFTQMSARLDARFPSIFNNSIKNGSDYYKNFISNQLRDLSTTLACNITEILNITIVMNFFAAQQAIKSLPENCSIYVKDSDSLEKNFIFHTKQCYVVTKNELLHLKKDSKSTEGFTKSVIECKNFDTLRKKLGKPTLSSGLIPNVPDSRIGFDTSSKNNLQTIINFIPTNRRMTVIYNSGSHKIRVNPLKPDETKGLAPPLEETKEIKHKTDTVSCIVKYFVENETLLIETSPFFSSENKEEFDFNNIKTQLISKAENMRQQATSTWQPSGAQAWLLLVSRLWVFQDGLEAKKFTHVGPIEPLYNLLHQASLNNLGKLIKALENTQTSSDDKVEIQAEHLLEIKNQWSTAERENKNQTLNWRQAFRHQNSKVAVEDGGPVRILAMQPVNHANKHSNFLAVPCTPTIKNVLDSRSVSFNFLDFSSAIVTSCQPSMIHNNVLSDTVREFFYEKNKYSGIYMDQSDQVSAKLTVVYSPIYKEYDGWAQDAEENRELIFKALSTKVFESINIFSEFWWNDTDHLYCIRERLAGILTQRPFNQIQSSLLFCLTVKTGHDYNKRFLVGIGSGVAIAYPKNSPPIIKIYAMYDFNDVPVSLDSLDKPIGNESESLTQFLYPSTRIQESLQIAIVKDPETEILLLSGRDFTHKSLKFIKTTKDLDLYMYAPDIKALEQDEKQSPIDKTIADLQPLRKELLKMTADPYMQSAWVKIKSLLEVKEVKNDQIPLEEEPQLVKSMTNAFKKLTDTAVLSDSFSSMFKKIGSLVMKEEEKQMLEETKETLDTSNMLKTKIKSVNECIHFEHFIEGCRELAESKISFKLTQEEINAVKGLWHIAVDEARPFSKTEEDDSSEIFISWANIRKIYFPYFQGVNDSMVVFSPTSAIEPPKLFEYIYGLAQQNFNSSTQHNKEEAKEILIFAHVLCSFQNESTILPHIRAKLESFNTRTLGDQSCDFWRRLEQLLIFKYAPSLLVDHQINMISLDGLIEALPKNTDPVSALSSNNMSVTPLVSGVSSLGFRVHKVSGTETTTSDVISSRSSLTN